MKIQVRERKKGLIQRQKQKQTQIQRKTKGKERQRKERKKYFTIAEFKPRVQMLTLT